MSDVNETPETPEASRVVVVEDLRPDGGQVGGTGTTGTTGQAGKAGNRETPPPWPAPEAVRAAVDRVLARFGGPEALLKSSGDVYVKPNGIDYKPKVHTSVVVLEAVIDAFQAAGARHVYLIENSTQSMFTRLVLEVTGYKALCKRTGATPVYLDEDKTETFEFQGKPGVADDPRGYERTTFEMPRTVARELVRRRAENLYVNVPKLKTHSMTGVTLGIKNQWGFPAQRDRGYDHNYNLHSKIVDVLEHVRPDFTIVDGIEGTIHGHYHAEALHARVVKPFRVLIGGPNVVAVDLVGARVFGLGPADVPHLRIALERGLGGAVSGWSDVHVEGDLTRFTETYPWGLYPEFPDFVNFVEGRELACREGCKNNPRAALQVFWLDNGGHGRFDLVYGKGFDLAEIDALAGPVLVAGKCAIEEVGDRLRARLGKKNVYFSATCNNLAQTAHALTKLLHIKTLDLVPLSTWKALGVLLKAKLHGSQANVPPVL